MTFDLTLSDTLSLDDELRHRARAIRAVEVAEALEEGVPRFVAVESFCIGADDRVIAGQTRVAWDHWLIRDRPEAFIAAWPNPAQRPLYDHRDKR